MGPPLAGPAHGQLGPAPLQGLPQRRAPRAEGPAGQRPPEERFPQLPSWRARPVIPAGGRGGWIRRRRRQQPPPAAAGPRPEGEGREGTAARLPEGLFPRSPVRGRAGPWGEPAPRRGKLLSRTARPLPGAGRERARLEALGLSPGGRSPWFWGGSGGGSGLGWAPRWGVPAPSQRPGWLRAAAG